MNLTLSGLLTPEGIVAGAALVTTIIAMLKGVWSDLDARVSGALMAFVLTLVLYVLAGVSSGAVTLDAWFAVFIAWVSCATSAVGIHSTVQHVADQRGT